MSIFKPKYFLNKRTLKLSFGNVISQVIPFLLMPILTRLYNPTEFGGLAVFVSITLVLSEIVTGKYELAVLLPKNDATAVKLTIATIGFNAMSSLLIFIIIFIFKDFFLQILDIRQTIGNWIYFIPFVIFFNGLYETLKDFSLRVQAYNKITRSFIERALSANLSQLALGINKFTSSGLLIGKILSTIIVNIEVLIVFIKEKNKHIKVKVSSKEYRKLLIDYKDFPTYSMPSSVLTTLSFQLILISIPILFTNSIAGLYLLAQRILNIPISIVGNSMQQVYFKDFSVIGNNLNRLKIKAWELYKKLFIIGIVPTFIIIAFGPKLFGIVFGNQWIEAGMYAQILSFWYFMVFITGPVSTLLIVLRKQKQTLIFQIISIILKAGLLFLCYLNHYSIENTLISFSILSGLLLVFYLTYIFYLIKIDFNRLMLFSITLIGGFGLILYLFKSFKHLF